ncbi:amino acid ABC transporter permease [Ferrovibrio xuzhouensis]|uniref:Amino acid ABC transporter permease n=1 Tax=Ferrovibrio xuzhouensis TaxID=1576914 RepID=A0ABV7VLL2_9PROT
MSAAGNRPLAVILSVRTDRGAPPAATGTAIRAFVIVAFCIALFAMLDRSVAAQTAAPGHVTGVLAILSTWTPAILLGFLTNIYISLLSMLVATVLGTLVGIGLVAERMPVRWCCWGFTHFFRNAPWLVILFYCMLLLPFSLHAGPFSAPLPDWSKAVFGIAIAASANMAEVVRGAIQSIPTGQWESAASLAFSRRQIIWMIILPQCVKRMVPGWMNLYALVMVSTPLCSVVGVREVMTTIADMLASYSRHDLLMPAYFYLLLLFFVFCFPIARLTLKIERRFSVVG